MWITIALAAVQVLLMFGLPRHSAREQGELPLADPELLVFPDIHGGGSARLVSPSVHCEDVRMRVLIVCASVANGNTRKVADAMAEVLGADVVAPDDVDLRRLADYDLIGLGSGIYMMSFHASIRDLVRRLPAGDGRRMFVFCTSGSAEPPLVRYISRLADEIAQKGYEVVGTFSCRGFDNWFPLRLVGGLNRGRPNDDDLASARAFASGLASRGVA